MAKDLPYFKFYCSEWNDGDITLEDYHTQGVFVSICSYYWSNSCSIELEKLNKRFRNEQKTIKLLIKLKLIKAINERIVINFLDEQLNERDNLSNQNSINARKRWEKIKSEKDAVALVPQSEKDAIKKREDKIRKEKKKIENLNPEVLQTYEAIIKFFNEKDIPKLEKDKNSWLFTINDCNLLDKYSFEDIIKITKKARNEMFWQKQFLTINKLRKKDKNGIKYIRVFEEINDSNQNQQTIGTKVSEKTTNDDFGFPAG